MPNPPIPEFNYQVNKDSTGQFREHMARLTHWGNQGWTRVSELERLFAAYAEHVGTCEGTDFLYHNPGYITESDWLEFKRIAHGNK